MSRSITFSTEAFAQLREWFETDKKTAIKIHKLIQEIARNPFEGTGKPEPLRNELSGYWSRRINEKDRLVYRATEEAILILSCKGHYE